MASIAAGCPISRRDNDIAMSLLKSVDRFLDRDELRCLYEISLTPLLCEVKMALESGADSLASLFQRHFLRTFP